MSWKMRRTGNGNGKTSRKGGMTINQIKRRYTIIRRCDGLWRVWLRVDQQSFLLYYKPDTRAEAEHYRDMLAIALKRLIERNKV